jgi:hypothetical protein
MTHAAKTANQTPAALYLAADRRRLYPAGADRPRPAGDTRRAFVLREYAPGVTLDEIRRKTAGRLIVPDDVCEMRSTEEAT